MILSKPVHLKQCMTHTLPHHETERHRSLNNMWSCILANQGFVQITEHITERLTASKAKIQCMTEKTRIPK
jgi:hypothetical protein